MEREPLPEYYRDIPGLLGCFFLGGSGRHLNLRMNLTFIKEVKLLSHV